MTFGKLVQDRPFDNQDRDSCWDWPFPKRQMKLWGLRLQNWSAGSGMVPTCMQERVRCEKGYKIVQDGMECVNCALVVFDEVKPFNISGPCTFKCLK